MCYGGGGNSGGILILVTQLGVGHACYPGSAMVVECYGGGGSNSLS